MESKSKFILYVVQPGDTIESIALKFNTTKEEIYRFNNGIKYHSIYPGIPLNIESLVNKQLSTSRETPIQNKFYIDINLIYQEIIYIRSSLLFSLFQPSLSTQVIPFERKAFNNLFTSINNNSEKVLQIQQFLCYLHESNERIASLIGTNNIENSKLEIADKKKKIAEYQQYLKSLDNSLTWQKLIEIIKECDGMWQIFIFKYASKQVEQAESTFAQIIEKETSLYKTLESYLFGTK